MRLSTPSSFVAVLLILPTSLCHVLDDRLPPLRFFGGRKAVEGLRIYQRNAPVSIDKRWFSDPDVNHHKKCGPGIGSCDAGDCCSPGGNCGRGFHFCSSPGCQMTFSNGCDAYTVPLGEPTTNISRPLIGNVTYGGEGIEQCMNDGDIALTFDDGPFNFTSHLLDVLASYGAKATFFITGNNLGKGQIDVEETGWPDVIRRMHREGHQIAAHTWTHQNLSSLNEGDMENQVVYVEMALRNILGFFPTYMRPPYSECSDACQALMKKMGYHITYQNLVTFDWDNDNDTRIQLSKDNFTAKMNKVTPSDINYITLNHDTHYQTTYNLSTYMLDYLNSMNFSKSVTVGQCMGDPQENWYRMAGGAPNRTLLETFKGRAARKDRSFLLILAVALVSLGTTM